MHALSYPWLLREKQLESAVVGGLHPPFPPSGNGGLHTRWRPAAWAARFSIADISGSGNLDLCNVTLIEGGNTAESSSSEASSPSDAAIDILSSGVTSIETADWPITEGPARLTGIPLAAVWWREGPHREWIPEWHHFPPITHLPMNRPQKLLQRAVSPNTWCNNCDRQRGKGNHRIQKRTGGMTSWKRRKHTRDALSGNKTHQHWESLPEEHRHTRSCKQQHSRDIKRSAVKLKATCACIHFRVYTDATGAECVTSRTPIPIGSSNDTQRWFGSPGCSPIQSTTTSDVLDWKGIEHPATMTFITQRNALHNNTIFASQKLCNSIW